MKTRAFIIICESPSNDSCARLQRRNCDECGRTEMSKDFCFVQFYEVLDNRKLKIEAVEKALKCIRIRWERVEGARDNMCYLRLEAAVWSLSTASEAAFT